MITEEIHAKNILDLGNIKEILGQFGIESEILKAGDINLLHSLVVKRDTDDKGREGVYSITFIPMDDDFLENSSVIQFFYACPFEVNAEKYADVLGIINYINLHQVIGHFGIKDRKQIYFRYNSTQAKYELLESNYIADISMLVEYAIDVYQAIIEEVNTGKFSEQQAIDFILQDS